MQQCCNEAKTTKTTTTAATTTPTSTTTITICQTDYEENYLSSGKLNKNKKVEIVFRLVKHSFNIATF